jgi:hypothetical protein
MTIKQDNKHQETNDHEISGTVTGEEKKEAKIEIQQLGDAIFQGYGINANDQLKKTADAVVKKYLRQITEEQECAKNYNVLILYDSSTMVKGDADNIYNAINSFNKKKPLLLILYSDGGFIASAYLIGKLCREHSHEKFVVVVPRQAKSAATLLCCAADEVHMGSLSELGPIDPQINRLPALGLKNSIEHIAQLVKGTPEASEMFAKYLHYSLKPIDLGYYERVAESAMQYAIRLLDTHKDKLPRKPERIAYTLVYTYKDHGFVIDKTEAQEILGDKILKKNTNEYELGNALYKALNFIERIANFTGHNFYFIGSIGSEPNFIKRSGE